MPKPLENMTIALTGGSGFIGQKLMAALLAAGVRVRALENSTPLAAHKRVTAIKGRVTDPKACEALLDGADAVVHIAGLVATCTPALFYKVNTDGTKTLAKEARKKGIKFLLYSSLSAREPHLSEYGRSKNQAEHVLQDTLPQGWDIFRPPAVYGPGDRQFLELVKMVQKGYVFLPASPKARASLIYVDDLVSATLAWLTAQAPQQKVYTLHDGQENGYLWLEVVLAMAKPLNLMPKVTFLPKWVTHVVAYVSLFLQKITHNPSFLPPEKMRQLTHPDWVTDDQTFLADYPWRPQVKAAEGFGKTVRWYKEQGLI